MLNHAVGLLGLHLEVSALTVLQNIIVVSLDSPVLIYYMSDLGLSSAYLFVCADQYCGPLWLSHISTEIMATRGAPDAF